MYKVFINDYGVEFRSNRSDKSAMEKTKGLSYSEFLALNSITENLIIYCENVDDCWKTFSNNYKHIAAAGGVVINSEHKMLFIYRLGKWDLPKGKVEQEEGIKEAAVREVEEECGAKGLEIINQLPNTYHTYQMKGESIMKTTYWYKMSCTEDFDLIPQEEEGITGVEWIGLNDLDKVLKNTYASIAEFLTMLK